MPPAELVERIAGSCTQIRRPAAKWKQHCDQVFHVEDNDDNVNMLKMRLGLPGHFEVLAAEDGEKGREIAFRERPDIILMDLEMPVIDVGEATRRLKGNPQTHDIPVIALSVYALAGWRRKAMEARCDEFDTKPDPVRASCRNRSAPSRAPLVTLGPGGGSTETHQRAPVIWPAIR